MNISDLFETPRLIDSENFGLDKRWKNIAKAKEFLSSSKVAPIKEFFSGVTLYKLGNKYALIDTNDKSAPIIWYYVQYEIQFRKFINKNCIQQVLVWRKMTEPKTNGFAKTMFFDYLLPETGCIVTDSLQTNDGQRFWFNRINDAFSMGKYVYAVDVMPPQKIIQIHSPNEIDSILDSEEPWGENKNHETRRIIITDKPI